MSRIAAFGVGLVLVVGLVGAGLVYQGWWVRTPRYSLEQIRDAVETHDVVKFEKHVDLDSVAGRAIDDVLAVRKEGQPGDLGQQLLQGLVNLLKPRLVELVKEQTIEQVENGDFIRAEDGEEDLHTLSAGLDESEVEGISYVRRDGKVAYVGLQVRPPELDAPVIAELKLRDMGGYWRVVEITNFSELLAARVESRERAPR